MACLIGCVVLVGLVTGRGFGEPGMEGLVISERVRAEGRQLDGGLEVEGGRWGAGMQIIAPGGDYSAI